MLTFDTADWEDFFRPGPGPGLYFPWALIPRLKSWAIFGCCYAVAKVTSFLQMIFLRLHKLTHPYDRFVAVVAVQVAVG